MDEVQLKIQKRAFPSHGRARLNTAMLSALGTEEGSKLEIVNASFNKSVTVTLYADSMVEEGYIRLSEEDLTSLGLQEGDAVTVRRKPPISEQMKKTAAETAERITGGVGEAKETVREKAEKVKTETIEAAGVVKGGAVKAYGRFVEEVTPLKEGVESKARETYTKVKEEVQPVAGEVKEKAWETYTKVKEEVQPVAEKVEGRARETYTKVREEVAPVVEEVEGAAQKAYAKLREGFPHEKISELMETVKSTLKPGDEAKLKKALEETQGSIKAATVSSESYIGVVVKDIDLPTDVLIAAVQRGKEIIIPRGDTRLMKGDALYLIGKENNLSEAAKRVEG